MTDSVVLGAIAFIFALGGVLVLCGLLVAALRERAYQRAKEREYAEAWQRLHRAHQADRIPARDTKPNRYFTDTDGSPE